MAIRAAANASCVMFLYTSTLAFPAIVAKPTHNSLITSISTSNHFMASTSASWPSPTPLNGAEIMKHGMCISVNNLTKAAETNSD